ncbi:MAG TPA: hypothetical protein VG323_05995, partial [Thermoanaerobaculia bacterium]|nr:hypothetical protein [Thermoanaerobaculia bacterium]
MKGLIIEHGPIMLYSVPPLRMVRLRFEMRPRTSVSIPPWRRGEVLYGAFGTVLRRTACDDRCPGAESCPRRDECIYARLFEPAIPMGRHFGETGGRKAFLFRAALDGGDDFTPHRPLLFELRLFGDAIDSWQVFADVFRRLSATGLADRAVDLVSVLSLDWKGTSARILFEDGGMTGAEPIELDFQPFLDHPLTDGRVRIEFLTPTLLKDRRTQTRIPSAGALIRRLRDRISLLSLLWERAEWQAEYKAIGELAELAVMRKFEGGWDVHGRHS